MSLKNLIKVADYYNVKYGFGKIAGKDDSTYIPPPPSDSSPKLDYALKMLSHHERELNNLKSTWRGSFMDPTYEGFKNLHEEAIVKYSRIIKDLTGVNLGSDDLTEGEY